MSMKNPTSSSTFPADSQRRKQIDKLPIDMVYACHTNSAGKDCLFALELYPDEIIDMPKPLPHPILKLSYDKFRQPGMILHGYKLYLFGGWRVFRSHPLGYMKPPRRLTKTFIIDLATGKRIDAPPMKSGKLKPKAVIVNEKILVFEGFLDPERTPNFELFDLATHRWTQLPEIPPESSSSFMLGPEKLLDVNAFLVHHDSIYLSITSRKGFYVFYLGPDTTRTQTEWTCVDHFGGVSQFPFNGQGFVIDNFCFTSYALYHLNDLQSPISFSPSHDQPYPNYSWFPDSSLVQALTNTTLLPVPPFHGTTKPKIAVLRSGYTFYHSDTGPINPHLVLDVFELYSGNYPKQKPELNDYRIHLKPISSSSYRIDGRSELLFVPAFPPQICDSIEMQEEEESVAMQGVEESLATEGGDETFGDEWKEVYNAVPGWDL